MDMLQEAMQELNDQFDEFAATEVAYTPSGGESLLVPATIGVFKFRYTNQHEQIVVTESRDFLISTKHLDFTPGRGDFIVEGDCEYQVSAPNREPCWMWSDEHKLCRRIHTSLIGEVEDDN